MKIGRERTCLNIIKAIYDKSTASIILSGEKLKTLLIIREMQIKLQWGTTSHLMATIKKSTNNKCSYIVGGIVNWYSHYGKQSAGPQKNKNRIVMWSSHPALGHIPRQNYNSKRYTYPFVYSSTVYNCQVWK